MKSHYETLEVSPHASDKVIRAAYRCIAQNAHPDKNPHSAHAEHTMAEINRAYAVLSDFHKRAQYDKSQGIRKEVVERRGVGPSVPEKGLTSLQVHVSRPFAFRPLV